MPLDTSLIQEAKLMQMETMIFPHIMMELPFQKLEIIDLLGGYEGFEIAFISNLILNRGRSRWMSLISMRRYNQFECCNGVPIREELVDGLLAKNSTKKSECGWRTSHNPSNHKGTKIS
ncbi:hypothetical protein Cni_G28855 [Canna indica]|uniref:Uncharacterized protein n=1 Tax=Canna indica TaxID=4628 RepID=A0AAQ3L388_9LILI|nr:hypothetical protein Cni_G28855 [Canna indica]